MAVDIGRKNQKFVKGDGMKFQIAIITSLLTVGCIQSSGVLKMGPDTYSISVHAAPGQGGMTGSKRTAINEANAHCSAMRKEIVITNADSHPSTHFPGGTTDVTFLCLDKRDIELKRPKYRDSPDIIIENR